MRANSRVMEGPEIPSLTDFNSGEDNSGNRWYVGTFSRNGVELKANNYEMGYSTRWNTGKSIEEFLDRINEFYRLKRSVNTYEVSEGDVSTRKHYLSKGDASISDYSFEDVMSADFTSDDFGATWTHNGKAIAESEYMLPYNVTIYVNEPVDNVPEPFMEPTWQLLPKTSGSHANREVVDQLTHDAGLFINKTDEFF